MTTRNVGYWITIGLVALAFAFGGVVDLSRSADVVAGMSHLGYPVYLASLLGFWKVWCGRGAGARHSASQGVGLCRHVLRPDGRGVFARFFGGSCGTHPHADRALGAGRRLVGVAPRCACADARNAGVRSRSAAGWALGREGLKTVTGGPASAPARRRSPRKSEGTACGVPRCSAWFDPCGAPFAASSRGFHGNRRTGVATALRSLAPRPQNFHPQGTCSRAQLARVERLQLRDERAMTAGIAMQVASPAAQGAPTKNRPSPTLIWRTTPSPARPSLPNTARAGSAAWIVSTDQHDHVPVAIACL